MKRSNYIVKTETKEYVLIKDIGPWDKYLSVTNDAEQVVAEMLPTLNGRRLLYIDSDGDRDELVIKDGKFTGYAPARGGDGL